MCCLKSEQRPSGTVNNILWYHRPGECDFTESICRVGTYEDVRGVMPDAADAIYRVPTVVHRPGGTLLRSGGARAAAVQRPGQGQKKAPDLSGAFKVAITYSSAFAVPSA